VVKKEIISGRAIAMNIRGLAAAMCAMLAVSTGLITFLSVSSHEIHDISFSQKKTIPFKSSFTTLSNQQRQLCLINPLHCAYPQDSLAGYMYYLPNVKFFTLPASPAKSSKPPTPPPPSKVSPKRVPAPPSAAPSPVHDVAIVSAPAPPPNRPPFQGTFWNRPLGLFGFDNAGEPIPRVCCFQLFMNRKSSIVLTLLCLIFADTLGYADQGPWSLPPICCKTSF
jgi:hypothetical protein